MSQSAALDEPSRSAITTCTAIAARTAKQLWAVISHRWGKGMPERANVRVNCCGSMRVVIRLERLHSRCRPSQPSTAARWRSRQPPSGACLCHGTGPAPPPRPRRSRAVVSSHQVFLTMSGDGTPAVCLHRARCTSRLAASVHPEWSEPQRLTNPGSHSCSSKVSPRVAGDCKEPVRWRAGSHSALRRLLRYALLLLRQGLEGA